MRPLLLVAAVGLLAGCSREPVHGGKNAAEWTKSLQDSDPKVRAEAARGLAAIGKKSEKAVPDLIKALKDPQLDVRLNAAGALGEIGADAQPAVPALTKALKDPSADVRDTAAEALKKIQKKK